MKFFIGICIATWIFMLTSCNNSTTQKVSTVGDSGYTIPYYSELFPNLTNYLQVQDSNFSPELFQEASVLDVPDSISLKVDSKDLQPYYPYLLFNSDSSYALDLVTYNYTIEEKNGVKTMEEEGPDYEVGIIDMKKKERKRLLFFGTMGSVMDATWEGPNVIMTGPVEWTETDSIRMEAWRYNVNDGKLKKFSYPDMIHAEWHKFPLKWMKKNI